MHLVTSPSVSSGGCHDSRPGLGALWLWRPSAKNGGRREAPRVLSAGSHRGFTEDMPSRYLCLQKEALVLSFTFYID